MDLPTQNIIEIIQHLSYLISQQQAQSKAEKHKGITISQVKPRHTRRKKYQRKKKMTIKAHIMVS